MRGRCYHTYEDIISLDNLFCAWQEFLVGKKNKKDVQEFSIHLIDNIVELHNDLKLKTYKHQGYHDFYINDPKRRHIHKASVRDRLLHHAVYRKLYVYFDKTFIYDSYSCRKNKGTHKALDRFKKGIYKVSKNNTKTCYVLQCDIKKFFENIDHSVLYKELKKHIMDQDILDVLKNIIDSFYVDDNKNKGVPLGNLTSQLFINIYMNMFDQWVKHEIKAKYYIRYADDFLFISQDKDYLIALIPLISNFLEAIVYLQLHPNKLSIKTVNSAVDFLGWVQSSNYKILRKKTKKRMFMKLKQRPEEPVFQSYLGLISHGDMYEVENEIKNLYWLLRK